MLDVKLDCAAQKFSLKFCGHGPDVRCKDTASAMAALAVPLVVSGTGYAAGFVSAASSSQLPCCSPSYGVLLAGCSIVSKHPKPEGIKASMPRPGCLQAA